MTAASQKASGYVILVLQDNFELKTACWWHRVTQPHLWRLKYVWMYAPKVKSIIFQPIFTQLLKNLCVYTGSEEAGVWCCLWYLELGDPALHHDSWVNFVAICFLLSLCKLYVMFPFSANIPTKATSADSWINSLWCCGRKAKETLCSFSVSN